MGQDVVLTARFDINPAVLALKTLASMSAAVSGQVQQQFSAALAGIKPPKVDTAAVDAEMNKLTAALNAYQISQTAVTKSSPALGDSVKQNSSVFASFAGRLVAVNQGIEAFRKVYEFVQKPIQLSANFEQYIVQFQVLLGSADAAKTRIAELSDFANRTPFELPEVVQASRLLQTFGGSALATGQTLKMVGDMASAAGAGFNEVAMWVGRAYTAIQAGAPFGEATMRLMELGLMSGETRMKLENLQATGAKASDVWAVFTGSMSKYNNMMSQQAMTLTGLASTMRDSINGALRDLGDTFLPILKSVVEGVSMVGDSFRELPSSMKTITIAAASMVAMGIMVNSSLGVWPYVIAAAATTIGVLADSIKNANTPVILLGAGMAGLLSLFAVMKVQAIIGATGLFSFTTASGAAVVGVQALKAQIIELNALLAANPWAVAIAAIAALGVLIYSITKSSEEKKRASDESMAASSRRMTSAILEDIKSLDGKSAKIRIEYDIATAQNQINQIRSDMRRIQSSFTGDPDAQAEQLIELEKQLHIWEGILHINLQAKSEIGEADKKAVESAAAAIDIQKAEAAAMQDGYKKQRAEIEASFKAEEESLRKRTAAGVTDHITQEQFERLKTLARKKANNEIAALDENRRANELKNASDAQRRLQEIEAQRFIDQSKIAEQLELQDATTERARLEITQRYAHARVQLEYEAALQLLGIESRTLNSELAGKPSEARVKEIQTRLEQIEIERQKLNQGAASKHTTIDVQYSGDIKKFGPDGSIQAAQEKVREAEDEMNRATTESARKAAEEKLKAHQNALDKMTMRSDEYEAHQQELWKSDHKFAAGAIDVVGKGFKDMWQHITTVNRQATGAWDALWLSLENSAIRAIGDIVSAYLEKGLIWIVQQLFTLGGTAGVSAAASVPVLPGFTGYAVGGKVTYPQLIVAGEGGQNELIAPEQSFYDVARREIIPNINTIALQQLSQNIRPEASSFFLSPESIKSAVADALKPVEVNVSGQLKLKGRDLYTVLKRAQKDERKFN